MEVKKLGKRFKQIREHLGLSQVQIAELIDTTQNIVSRVERGHGAGLNTLLKILNFYSQRVHVDNLFLDLDFEVIERDDRVIDYLKIAKAKIKEAKAVVEMSEEAIKVLEQLMIMYIV